MPDTRQADSMETLSLLPQAEIAGVVGEYNISDPTIANAVEKLGQYLETARNDPENRILYERQVPIMEDVHTFLMEHADDPRGYISVPTGVGKTVLFTEFVKATGLRTLVLTPTQILLKQTEAAFGKFAGDEEVTVGKVFANQKDESQITITTYASFMRHTKDHDSPFLDPEDYDVIILDEAHRALGDETRRVLADYPVKLRIGMTATEDYSPRKKLASVLPHEIHKMTIEEAVESNLISPFSVWVVQTETDMSKVRITTSNEYDQADLARILNTDVRNEVAAELYIKHFSGQKAAFFCSGVEHAKDLAEMFKSCGVPAEAIHGGLTIKQQQELKDRFADQDPMSGLLVLCNDKILAEGFDEPSIQVVFNLAPTLSQVRCQQRSGRALRLDPNNPQKEAIIIEFIDRNYIKPPVLFSDAGIAGAAHIGEHYRTSVDDNSYTFNLGSAHVITNPESVEQMSRDFIEIRTDTRPVEAPEDWLTISGLTYEFTVSAALVRSAMNELKGTLPQFVVDNSGKYKAHGVAGGVTTYYSPAVVETLSDFIKLPEVKPEGWLSAGEVAVRYNLNQARIAFGLRAVSKRDPEHFGEYVDKSGRAKKRQYFSPETIKAAIEAEGLTYYDTSKVHPGWIDSNKLEEMCGTETSKAALRMIRGRSITRFNNHSQLDQDNRYFSPVIVDEVLEMVTPLEGWVGMPEVIERLAVGSELVEEAFAYVQQKMPYLLGMNYRLCWVDKQEVPYFRPYMAKEIAAIVERLQASKNEPSTLEEGEIVSVSRSKAETEIALDTETIHEIEFSDVVIRLPSRAQTRTKFRTGLQVGRSEAGQQANDSPTPNEVRTSIGSPRTNISYLNALKKFRRR